MKAEVTIGNIYWNKSLSDFFFREQAYKTLEELVERSSMSGQDTLDALDEATDNMDIDDVEETFYSESVEYCADKFGIELEDEENEEDDKKYREKLQEVDNYIQTKTMETIISSHINK